MAPGARSGWSRSVYDRALQPLMQVVTEGNVRGASGDFLLGRVTHNAEFLRFAHHWDFRVRACRPYRAKTKGKVERPVSYVRSSLFYGRSFTPDSDLNAQAEHWLDTWQTSSSTARPRSDPRIVSSANAGS